jgi:hypothetical protein
VVALSCASVPYARTSALAGRPPVRLDHRAPLLTRAHTFFALARIAMSVRDSRATVHSGWERFQAVGEAGLRPASVLLDPASLLVIRVVSGGGGIRTPEGPIGPLRFSRPQAFGSTMRSDAACATQRATVRAQRPWAHRSNWDDVGVLAVGPAQDRVAAVWGCATSRLRGSLSNAILGRCNAETRREWIPPRS